MPAPIVKPWRTFRPFGVPPYNPVVGEDGDNSQRFTLIPSFGLGPVRYPNQYVWFVFFSALDVLFTWAIFAAGGSEVNPVAARVIAVWGLNGAIVFKFGLTLFVIVVCEVVGRERAATGVMLAGVAVIVSATPVVYSMALLIRHVYGQS